MHQSKRQPAGRIRRTIVVSLLLLGFVALAILWTPTIVAQTNLRNQIVKGVLGNPDATVTVEQATFGWFTTVKLVGLRI